MQKDNQVNNYFLLNNFCSQLAENLVGGTLLKVVSLNKNEFKLIAEKNNVPYTVRIFLGAESFIYQEAMTTIPNEVKYPFPEIHQLKIKNCFAHWLDRSLRFEFSNNFTLVIQLYGRNGNALLFEDNKVLKLFRPQFNKDESRLLSDYPLQSEITFEIYKNKVEESGFKSALKSLFPPFNSLLLWKLGIDDFEKISISEQWEKIQSLWKYLLVPIYYIYPEKDFEQKPQAPFLSLIAIPEEKGTSFLNVNEALQHYARMYFRALHFEQIYRKLYQRLSNDLSKSESYKVSAEKHLYSLDHERNYRQQADVLMAHLHEIPKGAQEVKLPDFYSDKELTIRLKADVSPQKWAEKLYAKAKNQEKEQAITFQKFEEALVMLDKLQGKLKELQSITDLKTLRQFSKMDEIEESEEKIKPFKYFQYQGYEIYVGKSAANNDVLSFKFANKEDLWLHAKDVTGSHVIIKHKNKDPFPIAIIEKAATLAAYYSKAKTSSLCPVSYTLKKYVRKAKKAPPGAVIIEKEKVLLVVPASFNEENS